MANKPFIALYKCFTGGEWFRASLDAVRKVCDGAVCMFSTEAWTKDPEAFEDCSEPLTVAQRENYESSTFKWHVVKGDWTRQEPQYRDGLKLIRETYGAHTNILIVDTDEIWEESELQKLKAAMDEREHAYHFRARIVEYVKSPCYQVWPIGDRRVVVGLGNAQDRQIMGRFSGELQGLVDVDCQFHHFGWVRRSEKLVRAKFMTTSSNEFSPQNWNWFEKVWPKLPEGKNIHPTEHHEQAWPGIRVIPPRLLPYAAASRPFIECVIGAENDKWRAKLESDSPDKTIVPQPTSEEWAMYGAEFQRFKVKGDWLPRALKTTVLEALWLALLSLDAKHIVEVGSGIGGSAALLSLGGADHVVCIDPFKPYDEVTTTINRNVQEGSEGDFWATINWQGCKDRITLIKNTSDVAASEIAPMSCDLAYVDGNHTYEFAKRDIRNYWGKLKPGGLLVVHDFTTRFPGVIRAVKEFEEREAVSFDVPYGTSLAIFAKTLPDGGY